MSATQIQPESSTYLSMADADLLLRLRIALSIKRRAGWHHVRISAQDGRVELNGVVPTFYDRQLIAALVRHVAGVMGIVDRLTVGDPSLRQQVAESKNEPASRSSERCERSWQNTFAHLPALPQSLDDAFTVSASAQQRATNE